MKVDTRFPMKMAHFVTRSHCNGFKQQVSKLNKQLRHDTRLWSVTASLKGTA